MARWNARGEGLPKLSTSEHQDSSVTVPIAGTNYTLRRVAAAELTPTERREIFELYVRAFDGEPDWFRRGGSASDAFEWKALEAPEGATLNLLEEGPRLAGVQLAMGKQFLLRGRPVVGRLA